MNNFSVVVNNVTQTFGRRLVFKDINFSFEAGGVHGISGPNGSGKSTLIKILAGLITPARGKIFYKNSGKEINPEHVYNHLGFVSPYLVLYDEFTALENILHFAKIRGVEADLEKIEGLFKLFNLYERKNDLVKGYSSGMKQRLKYIFALFHSPKVLLLDEPTSNLDNEGKETVYQLIKEKNKEMLLIIASNDDPDLKLCTNILKLEEYKRS